jgi:hypothetical protein
MLRTCPCVCVHNEPSNWINACDHAVGIIHSSSTALNATGRLRTWLDCVDPRDKTSPASGGLKNSAGPRTGCGWPRRGVHPERGLGILVSRALVPDAGRKIGRPAGPHFRKPADERERTSWATSHRAFSAPGGDQGAPEPSARQPPRATDGPCNGLWLIPWASTGGRPAPGGDRRVVAPITPRRPTP